ncbi:MAG: DUF560 domain-containing protein [Gammaproteobacteria bacterium]|nr:DUF560 domain-containing protein [Gammaproteobacteria bacterium]MCP4091718.1 DUF560 domain-containing protein [Gammaproteobacteria bacterium]MCP4831848.1 DUF560 domain-containing protein [Gammaproteobacteria bacterium]MCP4929784.1 DUF560 domain-containing protein [Gammaproteobacteria bacterium]
MLSVSPVVASADEIQNRFDAAMAALEADQIYTARRLLRELLTDYPTLYRARLELARADYLARDLDAAETEVLRVLEDPELPPSVQTTLLAFLAQIRDVQQTFEQKHRWSADFYGGGMYDSNVNYGVERDIVDLGGQDFVVLPGSQPIDAWASVLDGGVLYTYAPGIQFQAGEQTGFFLWQTQGNAYNRSYIDESDYNLAVATLRTGPAWVVPESWSATIGLQGDQIWYGGSKLAFFTTVNPTVSWNLSEATVMSAGLAYTKRHYNKDVDGGRDGEMYRGNLDISRVFMEQDIGVQAGVAYTDFQADNDILAYKGPDIYAGITYKAWQQGTIFTSVGYRKFKYQEALLLVPDLPKRDDDEYRLSAGFEHKLVDGVFSGWVVRGEWIYTDNRSNLNLYDFDRDQISLGLQRSF